MRLEYESVRISSLSRILKIGWVCVLFEANRIGNEVIWLIFLTIALWNKELFLF